MASVPKHITELNDKIYKENGERERMLREKCRREQMSRSKILMDWGDPAEWKEKYGYVRGVDMGYMEREVKLMMIADGKICGDKCDFHDCDEWGLNCFLWKTTLSSEPVEKGGKVVKFNVLRCEQCLKEFGVEENS